MAAQPEIVFPEGSAPVSTAVLALGATAKTRSGSVRLSNELVGLLSSQLYRTPIKAIEELVVNSFDADAAECYIAVPTPDGYASGTQPKIVAVLDDGQGMDDAGLIALWEIGKSRKRDVDMAHRFKRTQIGKFGIGKLATYAIANCVTYVSKSSAGIWAVTLDYRAFSKHDQVAEPVIITAVKVENWSEFSKGLRPVFDVLGVEDSFFNREHWTLCLLEDLKEKIVEIKTGRLRWVLSTAMPLDPTGVFKLTLGKEEVKSSKDSVAPVISFTVTEISAARMAALNQVGDENWRVDGDAVVSKSFPGGIRGTVVVYDRGLTAGKSSDLGRSNGFFIRVRNRLLNEDDESFGLDPVSFKTFNRFRADISVDDLDHLVLSSREEVEDSPEKEQLDRFLLTCFNEARGRFTSYLDSAHSKEEYRKEEQRQFVDTRLVERPVADVLNSTRGNRSGSEADDSWFYMGRVEPAEVDAVVDRLYTKPRTGYKYTAENLGRTNRMVRFDVQNNTFILNLDHEFVQAHFEDNSSRRVLYDFATAEALLEVHLREEGVLPHTAGEILERRDSLLRGLANDHAFSPRLIAQSLRDSSANKYDLEIHLVRAARTLGFVATHVSGAGEPDGIARLADYPGGEQKITLEAKSSKDIPQLSQLDVAGLKEHYVHHECRGSLVVAPGYPGATLGGESALSTRARQQQVSFWTIEQLARVVENVETRHITAADILEIVVSAYAPEDVDAAVEKLLSANNLAKTAVYRGIIDTLKALTKSVVDRPRTVDIITGALAVKPGFEDVTGEEVRIAIKQMSGASKGGLITAGGNVTLRISIEELENRLSSLLRDDVSTGNGSAPGRSRSGFFAKADR